MSDLLEPYIHTYIHTYIQLDRVVAEKLVTQAAEASGEVMECGCCFTDYPFEMMTQCSEGHLFCASCLKR